MKSKVEAIKISIIAIVISFIVYIGCQTDFYVSYVILKTVSHAIKALMENLNMQDGKLFYMCKDIYGSLLQQPGNITLKCIEMISSGVFGSALVTLIVYYVEYKIQLKEAIYELLNIQRKHVRQLNSITYVSAFADDKNNIKRNAYIEYSENALKLRGKERIEQRLKNRKDLNKKRKKEILDSNSQRLFQFQHEYEKQYRDMVWSSISDESKINFIEDIEKEAYLYDSVESLFFRTDFEIISAFFDYKEIFEKDISDLEKLSEEIYFLCFTVKKQNKKDELIKEAIHLDKRYIEAIRLVLGDSFVIQDLYDYFCGNRESLLHKIEDLQRMFFMENFDETFATREYKKWYVRIKKEILKENPDAISFPKPKNTFEIDGSGYVLTPDFLRKVKIQNWDYHKYVHADLNKMEYRS